MEDIIPWLNKYEFGIRSIDSQHRQLVQIINDLNIAIKTNKTHIEMNTIIRRLTQYTIHHFNHEESLFEKANYEKADKHKLEHENFKQKILTIAKSFKSSKTTNEIEKDLILFLVKWMISHIQDSDRDYLSCVLDNQAI